MSDALSLAVQMLLAALALPAVLTCLYLLLLTLLSARQPLPARSMRRLRFDVMVPAHNESAVIRTCVASLQRLDWPQDRFHLLVIADNCDDSTAALARDAGAQVLIRDDASRLGKGYALQLAFEYSLAAGWADAVVVVDADTEVSSNLLEAFAACIETGADAGQAHYGVLNPAESWRTGLMAIANGAFHDLRSFARERLQLSCGIRGNGWFVTHDVLRQAPYMAFSLTEDVEYSIDLGLAGCRVHYVGEAQVKAEMESGEQIAVRQRQRWEDGRFDLMRSQTIPLLRAALYQRSRVCLDLALDLLVLPLSYVAINVMALIVVGGLATWWNADLGIWLIPGLFAAASLTLYVLRGWQLSGRGAAGLVDLLRAPFFVLWKLLRVLRPHDRREWAPTRRRGP